MLLYFLCVSAELGVLIRPLSILTGSWVLLKFSSISKLSLVLVLTSPSSLTLTLTLS